MLKNKMLLAIVCTVVCLNTGLFAQETNIRYKNEVFSVLDSFVNVQYGSVVNLKGEQENLILDIYAPGADSLKKRPLMIFIHGGGFQNNNRVGAFSKMICEGLAKRGYVTATIDYRLGIAKSKSNTDYFEAMVRAVQDAKAAVRFFKQYGKKYGVDTSQIFVMGSSAGSKTAMHLAYLDEQEIPANIDINKMGGLEGNSGNPGYSSKVAGVVNCWGALINYKWINKGDVPMFNVSGTADLTVPYDSSYDYHGFKYGGSILYEHMLSLGIPTGWRPFYGAGHTLDNKKNKQDSAYKEIAAWLFTRLRKHAPIEPEVFKWEDDIQKLEVLDAKEPGSKKAILFIGSSYIRLWEKMKTDLAPYETINRGFGGSKMSDVAHYIDRLLVAHNPQAVFLYVGNDITGSNLDKSPIQVLELVKYITKKIRQKYPEVPVYWNQISPAEKRWMVWNKVSEANELVKTWAATIPQTYFVETGHLFLGTDGKPMTQQYFRDDKLHYNIEGYKVWAKPVLQKFNETGRIK
jgi:lysophospholipase L1-like esterase/dienelactone hydrolase